MSITAPKADGHNKAVTLVARVGDVKTLPPGLRPELGSCAECGAPVWISGVTLDTCNRLGAEIVPLCNRCVPLPGGVNIKSPEAR